MYTELILTRLVHLLQIEARSMACIVHDRTIGYVPIQSLWRRTISIEVRFLDKASILTGIGRTGLHVA